MQFALVAQTLESHSFASNTVKCIGRINGQVGKQYFSRLTVSVQVRLTGSYIAPAVRHWHKTAVKFEPHVTATAPLPQA